MQPAEVRAFDPSASTLYHEQWVFRHIYDDMSWFDKEQKPDPKLALSWRNVDPLTWEIKLRTGVKFSNGEPFNADAVVESFKYLTRPEAVTRAGLATWTAIEKVDDATVNVKTTVPDPRFLGSLINVVVMPPGVLKSNPASLVEKPIGTGPYKLAEWVKGDRIVLEANADYWRGKPKIDRIIIKSAPEASARVAALQSGQADVISNVPPESVDLLDKGANTKVLPVTGLRNVTIIFDTRTKPLDNVLVRRALNHAVDKESIIRNILGGRATIQTGTTHPLTPSHNNDLKPYAYDPQKAKQLLAEAGFPNGFEIEFHHPTGRWIKDVEVSQAVASMLEAVGVRAKLATGEYGTYISTWNKGEYGGMAMIGTLNLVEPDEVLQRFLYSKGTWPHSVKDPKIDAFYESEAKELDPAKRTQILQEAEAYVNDQAYWLFLYFQGELYGANKRMKWTPPVNEHLIFWDADVE